MSKRMLLIALSYSLVLGLGVFGGVYFSESTQTGEIWTCPMDLEIRETKAGKCPICGMNLVLESSLSHDHKSAPHNHKPIESESGQIWTCAMHPQIRQDKPGACPLCGMDLTSIVDHTTEGTVLKMTADAVKLAQIQTTPVKFSNSVTKTTPINGRIEVDQTQISTLVSHISGRIEALFVHYPGEKVKQGQKIATIYSPDFITAQKELLEAHKIALAKPELLEAAKNKLKFWKIPSQTIAEILKQGKIQEHIPVYADHTGIVHAKYVAVGNHLTEGQPLFDLQNLGRLWAIFDLYESDLEQVKIGSKIVFTTPAQAAKTFSAKVIFIDPVINFRTHVATIRTEVDNQKGILKPGMFVSGVLHNKLQTKYMSVPRTAVLWTGRRSVVYVKVPNNNLPSFEYRTVVLGTLNGENYTILAGLDLGEEVVTHGAFVIDAAAQLNNQSSMLNQMTSLKE